MITYHVEYTVKGTQGGGALVVFERLAPARSYKPLPGFNAAHRLFLTRVETEGIDHYERTRLFRWHEGRREWVRVEGEE